MAGPRSYSRGTRATLVVLSGGACYFPRCTTRIFEFKDGEPYTTYHIAHIRDARPGNRFDVSMTDDRRRRFENLILLCKPHHEEVDQRHPERYSAELMERWKLAREKGGLSALRSITEENLELHLERAVAAVARSSPEQYVRRSTLAREP
jgi:hypothetical protein